MMAPVLTQIVGEKVASQLIFKAGGLQQLARLPATTVMILGADKGFLRKR